MRFDFDAARLAGRPVEETAPWPVLGLFDEATGDWIAVDVADLLGEFLLRKRQSRLRGAPQVSKLPLEQFRSR